MADLIAIGYPDETTALEAEQAAEDLAFVPVSGMAIGAGLGAPFGKLERSGIDKEFQDQVRAMLEPGTSALFFVVEKVTPDKAVERLKQYGGTVLKTSLSEDAESKLQAELAAAGSVEPAGASA